MDKTVRERAVRLPPQDPGETKKVGLIRGDGK